MAETDLQGKTGEELEKAIVQKTAEKADATTMPPGTTIDPKDIEIKANELLN